MCFKHSFQQLSGPRAPTALSAPGPPPCTFSHESSCPFQPAVQRRLPATLRDALGDELAWTIMPRSYMLPDELQQLRVDAEKAQADDADADADATGSAGGASSSGRGRSRELWILKTPQHLGKGLKLVTLAQAPDEAAKPRSGPGVKPFVLAQRYVEVRWP